MCQPNTIVLCIDGLQPAFLQPYGGGWVETPAFNRLAAEGVVVEFPIIAHPDLGASYEAFFGGDGGGFSEGSLPHQLLSAGVETTLITDEPRLLRLLDHGPDAGFEHVIPVPANENTQAAETISQTHITGLFAALGQAVRQAGDPFFLWAHLQGLCSPWDAPYVMRQELTAEDDPNPPRFTAAPERALPADFDPDLALGIAQAYAAQIAVVDACLGAFLTELVELEADDAAVVLTSCRGYPLGEHRVIGLPGAPLYNELTHVPLMLRLPPPQRDECFAARLPALAQPVDLRATVGEFYGFGRGPSAETAGGRETYSLLPLIANPHAPSRGVATVADGQQRLIRTHQWSLRLDGTAGETQELFLKPDDRYDANEVAALRPEVVEELVSLAPPAPIARPPLL